MNIFRVNFEELYQRHLCRHSQFGLNVLHLVTMVGSYLAVYGILYGFIQSQWPLVAIAGIYLAVIAWNIPGRVFLINLVFIGLFVALFFSLPAAPLWAYAIIILVLYKIQALSHKIYPKASDMSDFSEKYKKGPLLFVLLSIYELPILLNYLVFDRKNWSA